MDDQLENDLKTILNVEYLPKIEYSKDRKFNRYRMEVKIEKPEQIFRRKFSAYQKNHRDIDIHAEPLKPYGTIFQYAGYLIGGIFAGCSFLVNYFNATNISHSLNNLNGMSP